LCAPAIARRLGAPADLTREPLLRSYRSDEWPLWFDAAGIEPWQVGGPVFDSSRLMVEAAIQGAGIALAPSRMFARELRGGQLAAPFEIEVTTGAYWLIRLKSRRPSSAMQLFSLWLVDEVARDAAGTTD
jgi:LysR family transcriptional regulator, regulator of gene expression of beta-lactamase